MLQAGQTATRATPKRRKGKFSDDAQYLAGDREQLGWDMTLSAWAALDTPERLQMLVDAQLPMPQRRRLLAQLLSHEQPQGRRSLLCALVAQLAPQRLALCAELMRQEAQQLQVTSRSSCPTSCPCNLPIHVCASDPAHLNRVAIKQHCRSSTWLIGCSSSNGVAARSQVFVDAPSLAQAACDAAYACGPNADWALLHSLTAEVQHALTAAMPAARDAAAEQGNDWGDWDSNVADASTPSSQDKDAGALSLTFLGSHLSTVSGDGAGSSQHLFRTPHICYCKGRRLILSGGVFQMSSSLCRWGAWPALL